MANIASAAAQRGIEAIANEARRNVLGLVWDRELPVSRIAELSKLRQPATSQHLRVLRDAGLVTVRIDRNRRLYQVDVEGVRALRTALEAFWGGHLPRLKAAAERRARSDPHGP